MANTIQLKRSSTASDEPVASDLEVGELAVNTADGKIFTKHTDGSIVTISGGSGSSGGSADEFQKMNTNSSTATTVGGQYLKICEVDIGSARATFALYVAIGELVFELIVEDIYYTGSKLSDQPTVRPVDFYQFPRQQIDASDFYIAYQATGTKLEVYIPSYSSSRDVGVKPIYVGTNTATLTLTTNAWVSSITATNTRDGAIASTAAKSLGVDEVLYFTKANETSTTVSGVSYQDTSYVTMNGSGGDLIFYHRNGGGNPVFDSSSGDIKFQMVYGNPGTGVGFQVFPLQMGIHTGNQEGYVRVDKNLEIYGAGSAAPFQEIYHDYDTTSGHQVTRRVF